jgi:hypothetical protein
VNDKEILDGLNRLIRKQGGIVLHFGKYEGHPGVNVKLTGPTLRQALAWALGEHPTPEKRRKRNG